MNPQVMSKIQSLSLDDKRELLGLLEELDAAKKREACQDDYLTFVKEMWAAFIHGKHHEIMADAL